MKTDDGALARFLRNNRWVLLLFLTGAALLLLPTRRPEESQTESVFTREEERLCAALECMDGVGPVRVLLAGGLADADDEAAHGFAVAGALRPRILVAGGQQQDGDESAVQDAGLFHGG